MTLSPEQLGQSKQELAATLKELRKRAGLSGARLAARCNMSQSKISRIENGKSPASLVDVEQILRTLEAPPEVLARVTELARLANTDWQSLRALRRKGLHHKQQELAGLESSSTEFRFFLLSMITGLLSTPEYIKASLAHLDGDQSKLIARKLSRQEVLYDTSKKFTFLLSEMAVRWPLIPAPAMAMQLDRLVSVSRLPNVRFGVIPLRGLMPVAPMDTFTVYDASLVTIETTSGVLALRDSKDVAMHLEAFAAMERFALFGGEMRSLLEQWSDDFRGSAQ
ncbi:helix-turn-helix domain-containing protein [Kitasatospora kifunensis]|uniref:Transcriptional regulator with XRE-family HTH domain n=1 Tax=Kitasatospora kifunensis TaxID=58351 RepID=A0A7W7R1P5_KITKI|nr:helix-turn-helix transcriptional regulator [Kitasatospora kifunensis]MBB4923778.1 transcriptional regulator with XRE-family HTH domain [Kitasatospora kifunensis]